MPQYTSHRNKLARNSGFHNFVSIKNSTQGHQKLRQRERELIFLNEIKPLDPWFGTCWELIEKVIIVRQRGIQIRPKYNTQEININFASRIAFEQVEGVSCINRRQNWVIPKCLRKVYVTQYVCILSWPLQTE